VAWQIHIAADIFRGTGCVQEQSKLSSLHARHGDLDFW
jgi:hypothetical protein